MALSATQTRESEAAVQSALVERQKKEAERRKLQEEKDKKDRELEAKLRLKRFEEEKKQREREKVLEETRSAKEREKGRREAEQRDSLRYGPKRGGGGGGKSDSTGGASRRRYDSDDEDSGGMALTREEKRKRRMENELRFGMGSYRKGTQAWGRKSVGGRLRGGVMDATATNEGSNSRSYASIKERLTAEPNMLIKLNTKKRDTRTIDEITRDIAKSKGKDGKTLEGDRARDFSDWFGTTTAATGKVTKAQTTQESQPVSGESSMFGSPASSPEPDFPPTPKRPGAPKESSDNARARTMSKSATPPVQSKPLAKMPFSASASSQGKLPPTRGSGLSVKAIGKPSTAASSSTPKPSMNRALSKSIPSFKKNSSSAPSSQPTSTPYRSSNSAPSARKRGRSPSFSSSLSPSPPPSKRRPTSGAAAAPRNDISSAIWQMFGKDRSKYVNQDTFSDDEDMEADASAMEREEMISARIARKEEELAMEEERRHEEEKRRKRKERDRRM